MQTIKITTTCKGEHHWEDYLIQKQKDRLNKLLTQLNTNPWVKRKVNYAYKKLINRENIIPLSNHPIRTFLHALLQNNLKSLLNNSTATDNTKTKIQFMRDNLNLFINFKCKYLNQTNYKNLITDFYLMHTANKTLYINLK